MQMVLRTGVETSMNPEEYTTMEREGSNCLARLPSRKTILVTLIVLATALTLILVHVSGQWVGQRVFRQIHRPGKQRLRSREGLRKPTQISWKDLQDWNLKKEPPVKVSVDGHSKDTDVWENIDASSEESLPSESIFEEMEGLDLSEPRQPGKLEFGTREQTIHVLPTDKSGDLSQGFKLVNQTSGESMSTTEQFLQTTIRREMVQMRTATQQPQKARRWSNRNVYNFDERRRKSYHSLPLRQKGDKEWKRENALIFNRVGKCGSRTVIELLRKLSDLNDFNFVSSIVYNMTSVSSEWEGYLVSVLDQLKTPYLFQRHLYFVNFSAYHASMPMYINIVRDPLSRFVSNYYFKRFGDGKSDQNFKGTEEEKNRSVTDCILGGYGECVKKGLMYIIPFFCGQHKNCRKPSQWALDRAKENVRKHFVVVGILEDLENSFRVFEKVLPRYFKGVVKLYLEPDEKQAEKNASTVTKFKEKPSPKAEAIMKRLMHYEYEFYNFVKDRLAAQMALYGIRGER